MLSLTSYLLQSALLLLDHPVVLLAVLAAVLIAVFGVAVLAVSLVIVLVHVVIIFAIVCHDKALLKK